MKVMENIPTAREIFKKYSGKANRVQDMDFEEMMIEFAKLHVGAALKEAYIKAEIKIKIIDGLFENRVYKRLDYDSVLNAYPLENIK